MEHMWDVPAVGYYKINVHCEISTVPSAVGNSVAAGVIIRDRGGEKAWGAQGPMNHLTEEQAIMAGIQAAVVHAKEKGWELTHIETTHRGIFELISDQDQFIIPEELLEAFRLFNSVHANHQVQEVQDPIVRKISLIPDHMNSVAIYLADYGLHHSHDLVELPGKTTVGNLQYLLDRDMGLVFAEPGIELVENMGLGEVIDDAPPPPPPNRKRKAEALCIECGSVGMHIPARAFRASEVPSVALSHPAFAHARKGKAKDYETYSFYDNGAFTRRAIEVLNSGALLQFHPSFGESELNLEAHVMNGFCVKDILHHACLDTLGMVQFMLEDSFAQAPADGDHDSDLMPYDQVEAALDFDDAVVPVLVEAGMPGASAAVIKEPGFGASCS